MITVAAMESDAQPESFSSRTSESEVQGQVTLADHTTLSPDLGAISSLVRVEGVTRVYHVGAREVHALRGVSLKIQKGEVLDALGDYQDELREEEELSGPQKMAQRMFGFLGRLTGGGADLEYNEDEAFDVIDAEPLPSGEDSQPEEE